MSDDNNDSNGSDNRSAAKKFDIDSYWTSIKGKWVKSETASKVSNNTVKVAKFKDDLKRGHGGEHRFYNRFAGSVTHLDGRNADFEINKTGETVELKTDYYDMNKTPNFFMERYSFDDRDGGPWQSLAKSISYYIYTFDKCGTIFVFNTAQLVRRLNRICKKHVLANVPNSGYTTRGYRIPRESLESVMLSPEEIGLVEKKAKK